MSNQESKQLAAKEAVKLLEIAGRETVIGCGTGSTVAFFVPALAARIKAENLSVAVVVTSDETKQLCSENRIKVLDFASVDSLDYVVDGADEWTESGEILKGAGGALFDEKLVIGALSSSGEFIVIVDHSKQVLQLGQVFPVPVEVDSDAFKQVFAKLSRLPGVLDAKLRRATAGFYGPVYTRRGNLLIDLKCSVVASDLDQQIKSICGVIETGIFSGLASKIIVGESAGTVTVIKL